MSNGSHPLVPPTSAQCRGARAMLGWSQEQLAEASNLTRQTIAAFENETRTPGPNNLLAIRVALEHEGVVFIGKAGDGQGVRLKTKPLAKDASG